MSAPIEAWGRRLSDAIRAALEAGDPGEALRLVRTGDGQTRNLASEYTLMCRGLGITIRILIALAGGAVADAEPAIRAAAAPALTALLHRLRIDLAGFARRVWGDPGPVGDRRGTLAQETRATLRRLDAIEARFSLEQQRLAGAIEDALETGDHAQARALVEDKEQAHYLPLHDRLVRCMAECFALVLQEFGADALLRFHLATAEAQRAGFEKWERMGAAEFAQATAFLVKQHMGQVAVSEDADKFIFEQTPCGSGGRLQLAGAYSGAGALPFVETPGPLTFGRERLPVYCTHCAIWNGVATLRWFGRVHWTFDDAARPDGGCTMHIYKRRDGAPASYIARLAVADG